MPQPTLTPSDRPLGPPRIAGLMRSALLAADLALIPAQPSPFDGWASGEILKLIHEARIFRPQLVAWMRAISGLPSMQSTAPP